MDTIVLVLNIVVLVLLPFVAKKYLEGKLKLHFEAQLRTMDQAFQRELETIRQAFEREVESIRQTFQREIVTVQSQLSYKQLVIAKSFDETIELNRLMWEAYWNHQDLWSPDKMTEDQRKAALETLNSFRLFLFSHQVFYDFDIFDNAIQLAVKMLSLSRYRAILAQPPAAKLGKDTDVELEINHHLDAVTRLIREKFQMPALPADLIAPRKADDQ